MSEYKNAEVLVDNSGKQYHLGLTSNDIADKIILVGDPDRVSLVGSKFDKIFSKREHREFTTYTGSYQGIDITVMSTGMGCGCMEIAVIELSQLKFPLTMVRCGTCGALQDNINTGDLIISSGALNLDNTTSYFVENNYPPISSYEVNLALLKSSAQHNAVHHLGITATAPGFYGAQCRNVPGFPVKDKELIDRLAKQNVKNLEMETGTLLTLANLRGFRAGSICAALASRTKNQFVDQAKLKQIEQELITVCLDAFVILDKLDRQKGDKEFWLPNI